QTGRALGDHRLRRLDGKHLAVSRLVVARARAHVEHRAGVAERALDRRLDARIRAPRGVVGAPDAVVELRHWTSTSTSAASRMLNSRSRRASPRTARSMRPGRWRSPLA